MAEEAEEQEAPGAGLQAGGEEGAQAQQLLHVAVAGDGGGVDGDGDVDGGRVSASFFKSDEARHLSWKKKKRK